VAGELQPLAAVISPADWSSGGSEFDSCQDRQIVARHELTCKADYDDEERAASVFDCLSSE
jgi:hypothetical protein